MKKYIIEFNGEYLTELKTLKQVFDHLNISCIKISKSTERIMRHSLNICNETMIRTTFNEYKIIKQVVK